MRRQFDPLLKIALTANLFEWYEFSLTAFMALQIGQLFFQATTDKMALMLSFSVFASTYSLSTAIFGGTAPILCGYLIERTGLLTAPAPYLIAMGILAAPVAFKISLKKRNSLQFPADTTESEQRRVPSSS